MYAVLYLLGMVMFGAMSLVWAHSNMLAGVSPFNPAAVGIEVILVGASCTCLRRMIGR